MKLLIVTSIREDLHTVSRIMEEAGIKVFSVSDTVGHKTEHNTYLLDNWFGNNEEGTDALFTFSFTGESEAARALELIHARNQESQTGFPVRGFILPVEAFAV